MTEKERTQMMTNALDATKLAMRDCSNCQHAEVGSTKEECLAEDEGQTRS